MKKYVLSLISVFTLALCFSPKVDAKETIEYYGSKAGLLRPCKGSLDQVCKRIIREDDELQLNQKSIDGFRLDGQNETVIIEYDGMQYVVPADAVNWEDGSIDESKL